MAPNDPSFGGLKYVVAPSVEPRPFGLFSVALFVNESDPHWQQGVQWEGVACEAAALYGPKLNCDPDELAPKVPRDGVPLTIATPFTVVGSFSCSPFGHWDDAVQRATDHLLAGEERAVELAIATGTAHTSNAFASPTTVDVTPTPGTAVGLAEGWALLEQYLAANDPSIGVIHAAPYLATLAASLDLVRVDGTQLRTLLGTRVAAGGGLTGLVPPGSESEPPADGEFWLYATGRPVIRRSEVWTPATRDQSFDQRQNNLTVFVERTYVVGWDCVTAAVLVSPSLDGFGTGGVGGPVEP